MPHPSPAPVSDGGGPRIRSAIPADVPALLEIEAAAFATDRLSRRSLRALVGSRSAHLLVAELAGGVAGYALVLTRKGSRSARLYSLAVSPDRAGHGLGSGLLAAAEAAAVAAGASRLTLEVRLDNSAARRLYERAGYMAAGRIDGYYADGAPAARYRLALPREVGLESTLGRAA